MFPGDSSEDEKTATHSTNNNIVPEVNSIVIGKELNTTKQPLYVIASMKYLMQLTLMVLAGSSCREKLTSDNMHHLQNNKIAKSEIPFPKSGLPHSSNNDKGNNAKYSEFNMPSLSLVEANLTVNSRRAVDKNQGQQSTAHAYLISHINDHLRVISDSDMPTTSSFATESMDPLTDKAHSIVVPHICLPRRDELEMLLMETCKLFAALVQPVPSEVSLKAISYLEVSNYFVGLEY